MKKKLIILFAISVMTLLSGCSSSEKKTKEIVPVIKAEVKPVVNEVKPEVKETVTAQKTEIKGEEKITEKSNVIIIVCTKEEVGEILKSVIPNANIEVKGLKADTVDIKKEIKPEIKIETKADPVTEKNVAEVKKENDNKTIVSAVAVAEKEIIKAEVKDVVLEGTVEKVTEKTNDKKEEKIVPKAEEITDKNTDSDKDGIPDYLDAVPNQMLKETLVAQGIQKVIINDNMKETDTKLTSQMAEEFDKIAAIMKKDKTLKIKIVAHTNNIGNEAVNLKLSEKRAIMAENYLNLKGIPLDYVATDWKGGSMPMVSNDTKENRAQNKRLEVIFYIVNIKAKK